MHVTQTSPSEYKRPEESQLPTNKYRSATHWYLSFFWRSPGLVLLSLSVSLISTLLTLTPSILLGAIIIALAVLSIFIGVFLALKRSDFTKMIAYAAVAEIGYMFLAFGAAIITISSTENGILMSESGFLALKAGIFHIFNE